MGKPILEVSFSTIYFCCRTVSWFMRVDVAQLTYKIICTFTRATGKLLCLLASLFTQNLTDVFFQVFKFAVYVSVPIALTAVATLSPRTVDAVVQNVRWPRFRSIYVQQTTIRC